MFGWRAPLATDILEVASGAASRELPVPTAVPTQRGRPHLIREGVRDSVEALREGRLKLTHASLSQAEGAFQRHLTQVDRPRRWTH